MTRRHKQSGFVAKNSSVMLRCVLFIVGVPARSHTCLIDVVRRVSIVVARTGRGPCGSNLALPGASDQYLKEQTFGPSNMPTKTNKVKPVPRRVQQSSTTYYFLLDFSIAPPWRTALRQPAAQRPAVSFTDIYISMTHLGAIAGCRRTSVTPIVTECLCL
jgi:hypothetical protein